MKTIAKRLFDGQDLIEEINALCSQYEIKAGVILSAVGSLRQSNIRVPVLNNEVRYVHPENVEIDGLHGTVSNSGCHLHISVSDVEGKVFGGHVKSGCKIRTTCELVIGLLADHEFTREPDVETGYDELVVHPVN